VAKAGDELYTVLIRQKIRSTPGMTQENYVYAISYTTPGQAPVTLFIPEKDWSPDKEKKAILSDIEARKKFRPEVVRK
jgi:hypothetical protein